MAEALNLTVVTPSEPGLPTGGGDLSSQSSLSLDSGDGDELSSGEEQSAAAALLGLGFLLPSSPDDDDDGRDDRDGPGISYDAAADLWEATNAAVHRMRFDSPGDPYSPKTFRHSIDYDTPGNPSPKRMRAPKDGTPHCSPRPPHPPAPSLHLPPWAASGHSVGIGLTKFAPPPSPPPPLAGAPPPGTSRFRCKFPGCRKLYASTDAVRAPPSVHPSKSHQLPSYRPYTPSRAHAPRNTGLFGAAGRPTRPGVPPTRAVCSGHVVWRVWP